MDDIGSGGHSSSVLLQQNKQLVLNRQLQDVAHVMGGHYGSEASGMPNGGRGRK